MSKILDLTDQDDNQLKSLAKGINILQDKIDQGIKISLESAWDAGEKLLKAKKLVPHGEWTTWLKGKVSVKESQCRKYMQLRKAYDSKHSLASVLSIEEALGYAKVTKQPDPELRPVVKKKRILANPKMAKKMQQYLDGEKVVWVGGSDTHAHFVVKNDPELARQVIAGEINAVDAFQRVSAKLVQAEEAAEDQAAVGEETITDYANRLMAIVDPVLLRGLLPHEQSWMRQDYKEMTGVLDSVSKGMSKKAVLAFMKLMRYQTSMMRVEIQNQLPDTIQKREEKLAKAEAELKKASRKLHNASQSLKRSISDKDIKMIQNCLHPDRAPEDRRSRFEKAFQAFSEAL